MFLTNHVTCMNYSLFVVATNNKALFFVLFFEIDMLAYKTKSVLTPKRKEKEEQTLVISAT